MYNKCWVKNNISPDNCITFSPSLLLYFSLLWKWCVRTRVLAYRQIRAWEQDFNAGHISPRPLHGLPVCYKSMLATSLIDMYCKSANRLFQGRLCNLNYAFISYFLDHRSTISITQCICLTSIPSKNTNKKIYLSFFKYLFILN